MNDTCSCAGGIYKILVFSVNSFIIFISNIFILFFLSIIFPILMLFYITNVLEEKILFLTISINILKFTV